MNKIKMTIFQIVIIALLSIFIVGCDTPPEQQDELIVEYEQLLYYSQQGYIEVESIYEDDEIYIESTNTKIVQITEEVNGYYITKAVGLGEVDILINSLHAQNEYKIIITVDAKEGFAPPIEKMELKIKEEGPYYVGETYHLEYKIYPEIYNDTFRYISNKDYELNDETNEIVFKHAGSFVVSIFSTKKSIRTNITVDVEFPKDKEMYEILFIGNSLTYVMSVPGLIQNMISADGVYVSYCEDTPGGSYLKDHRDNFDILINKYDFTHVILQGQSYEAISNFNEFKSEIIRYNDIIKSKNNNTQTILYQTWAYNKEIHQGLTKYDMTKKLAEAYGTVANEIGAKVTRSGEAFKLFETQIGLTPSLYQDMNHQSLYGAYLSACVHYSTLTGRKASNNTYVIEGIDIDMLKTIQSIADQISFE